MGNYEEFCTILKPTRSAASRISFISDRRDDRDRRRALSGEIAAYPNNNFGLECKNQLSEAFLIALISQVG